MAGGHNNEHQGREDHSADQISEHSYLLRGRHSLNSSAGSLVRRFPEKAVPQPLTEFCLNSSRLDRTIRDKFFRRGSRILWSQQENTKIVFLNAGQASETGDLSRVVDVHRVS